MTIDANTKKSIHTIIGLLLMFGFGFLPTFSTVTEYGMQMLGVFLGIIYLWQFVDMVWPSIAAFVAYCFFSNTNIATLAASGFGNQNILIMIFGLLVVYTVINQGVFDNIVPWIMRQKFLSGRPWRITIALVVAIFILQLLQTKFATVYLMFAVIYKICDSCGMPKSSKWAAGMCASMVLTNLFASFFYPFSGASLFVMTLFKQLCPDLSYSYISFTIATIGLYLFVMTLFLLALKFVVKVDVSPLKNVDVANLAFETKPLTKSQKILIAIFITYLILMFLSGSTSMLPEGPFTSLLVLLGPLGISFLFFVILIIYRVDGKSAVNLSKLGSQVPWATVFILFAAFTVCANLMSNDTGLPQMFAKVLGPILSVNSVYLFSIILFTACIILTNLSNNTVVIFIIFNILCVFAPQFPDINYVTLALLLLVYPQIAMLLPASSVFGAVYYGEQETIGNKNCLIMGATIMACAFLSLFVAIPFLNMLF